MMNMITPPGKRKESAYGSTHCKHLALTVLDGYTDELIHFLERSPDKVSVNEIRRFLENYKSNTIQNQDSLFKAHADDCLSQREREIFDPYRRHPFKQVLTMRFVDLFAPQGAFKTDGAYLSRRLLPGLFLAFEKMVGERPFLHGHKVCMELVEELNQSDAHFHWEDLYESEQCQRAVDDLLMALLPHFAHPMKRVNWMVNLINGDLADPEEYHFEGPANRDWLLDERGMIRLLRRLFHHLKHQLVDKEHAKILASTYSVQQTRALLTLVNALDEAKI